MIKARLIQCNGVSVLQAIALASEYPIGKMKISPQAKTQVIAVMGLYFFMSLGAVVKYNPYERELIRI